METILKNHENGSHISDAGNEENGAAGIVSDRDLKILSLEYAGECDGTYYFRDPLRPGALVRGSYSDVERLVAVQEQHPLIDAGTASAILRMREMQKTRTPFGVLAGDLVGS